VVSSSVKTPIPRLVLSNAFRPGIVGVAKTLAGELAPEGIRVNCVAPGRIDTERVRELDAGMAARAGRDLAAERRLQEARIPLGRYGTPEEFAAAVRFLASDAARYLTGQTIVVDGGLGPTLT
jgi:3-oxoacyl-[acyl-carrier protein] reductase